MRRRVGLLAGGRARACVRCFSLRLAEGELHGVVAVALPACGSRSPGTVRPRARSRASTLPSSWKTWVMPSFLARIADMVLGASRISMSTPAGRWSSRWSESTVLGVGWWMSIRRLCVRISKCSRESLSLNGERITQ